MVIYKITNTENGKCYIGQTRNWKQRLNAYRSVMNNKNSSEYNRPIVSALRKYGWKKFNFEIIEEVPGDCQDLLDEREMFFITHFQSLTSQKGYNIQIGGQGTTRDKKTFEQCLQSSKVFTSDEVIDIQKLLLEDKDYDFIIKKYSVLTNSFLSNINLGLNFYNPNLAYPLKANHHKSKYSKKEIQTIKQLIKSGVSYPEIQKQFDIKSAGFLSMINTGKYFFDKRDSYPLNERKYGRSMSQKAQYLLITGEWKGYPTFESIYREIAPKVGYNQTQSVKKINYGWTRKKDNFKYPLLENQEYNRTQI